MSFNGAYCTIDRYLGKTDHLYIPERFYGYIVNKIGDCSFVNCDSLQSITLPGSIREIGCGAFAKCVNLERIDICDPGEEDNRVDIIKSFAFYGCSKLKHFDITHIHSEICDSAFLGCGCLGEIAVPKPEVDCRSHDDFDDLYDDFDDPYKIIHALRLDYRAIKCMDRITLDNEERSEIMHEVLTGISFPRIVFSGCEEEKDDLDSKDLTDDFDF